MLSPDIMLVLHIQFKTGERRPKASQAPSLSLWVMATFSSSALQNFVPDDMHYIIITTNKPPQEKGTSLKCINTAMPQQERGSQQRHWSLFLHEAMRPQRVLATLFPPTPCALLFALPSAGWAALPSGLTQTFIPEGYKLLVLPE